MINLGAFTSQSDIRMPRSMREGRNPYVPLEHSEPVFWAWGKEVIAAVLTAVFIAIVLVVM
jgi:hypothetical protein